MSISNNIFVNTMLQEAMVMELRATYPDLELGGYFHNAGSMHIYSRHFSMAKAIIAEASGLELPMAPMDAFNDNIVTGLIAVEAAWQRAGAPKDFAFEEVAEWKLLTPYWRALVKMCFADDHEAMHEVFGIEDHS